MSSGVEFEGDVDKYGRPSGFSQPRSSIGLPPRVGSTQSTSSTPPNYNWQVGESESGQPAMVRWLMRKGIAKSPNIGRIVLFIVIAINIVITYVMVKYFL